MYCVDSTVPLLATMVLRMCTLVGFAAAGIRKKDQDVQPVHVTITVWSTAHYTVQYSSHMHVYMQLTH